MEQEKIQSEAINDEIDIFPEKEEIINGMTYEERKQISDEFTQCNIELFDKKFPILPKLKGKQLHDYKNFLNKCQQIFGLKYWDIYPKQSALFEKLTLLWATWGAYNLKLSNNTPTEDTPEKSKEEMMLVCDDDCETTNDNDLTKSNEEKAKEIAQEHEKYTEKCRVNLHLEGKSKVDVARETAYSSAIDMAEWKDEQFKLEKQALIDNACEFLYKYNQKQVQKHGAKATLSCVEYTINVDDFKKQWRKTNE